MPAVGKSTVGVIAAKLLGKNFVDTDLIIQHNNNMLLKEIITTQGIDGLLKQENMAMCSLKCDNSIISTGGSAVYSDEGMTYLKSISKVVYLKADFEQINARLKNIKNRGVVVKQGQSLWDLYQERTPLYEKYADIVIDENGKNVEQVVAELVDQVSKISNN